MELSQGAISQDALRRARGAVGDAYHKLRDSVRASPLVHTDDAGWRVEGGPAFLVEGMSIREASRVFGLHRDTARKMVAYSVPPGYRRHSPPRKPKLEPFTGEELLELLWVVEATHSNSSPKERSCWPRYLPLTCSRRRIFPSHPTPSASHPATS